MVWVPSGVGSASKGISAPVVALLAKKISASQLEHLAMPGILIANIELERAHGEQLCGREAQAAGVLPANPGGARIGGSQAQGAIGALPAGAGEEGRQDRAVNARQLGALEKVAGNRGGERRRQ